MSLDSTFANAIGRYGEWLVGGVIAVESFGVPFPGETVLVAAALYAGASGKLSIVQVVLAAIVGAVAGSTGGFWLGRTLGFRWIMRHRSKLRLSSSRLKIGQYLFLRHGGKVVFFGRFVPVLRALGALLAGVNCMVWDRFLLFNALGAAVWASVFGIGAYVFGEELASALSKVGLVLGICAAVAMVAAFIVGRRYERRLEALAERALPGPLGHHPQRGAPPGGSA